MKEGAAQMPKIMQEVNAPKDISLRFFEYMSREFLSEYDLIHRTRLIETMNRCEALLGFDKNVVELGGLSTLARYLSDCEGIKVEEYSKDLRYPFSMDDESQDLVFMLEVLEHLSDAHRPDSKIEEIAMFTMSGAISCLCEVRRVLKPGGYCVLTTPNAASVDAIGRILLKMHPYQYEPHVREYSIADISKMAHRVGLKVVEVSTFFSWNALPGVDRRALLDTIERMDYDSSDRGDDIYIVLQK